MRPTEPRPAPPSALVSIHDVMPDRLDAVAECLRFLEQRRVRPVTLLVVPGLPWSSRDIDRLRAWLDRGHALAGHGWRHRIDRPRGLYHRLHAALVSRDVAEHLALSPPEIAALIVRNHTWFAKQGLPEPDLYVPPAWAMGAIARDQLRELPFARYECAAGVYEARADRLRRLPLVGFEADRAWRRATLGAWNALNQALAGPARPLRVAIHPWDLRLPLAGALAELLDRDWRFLGYEALG